MAETTLAKKLHLKPGMRAMVINAPPGYIEQLGLPVDTDLSGKPAGSMDFVQIFVKGAEELRGTLPALMRTLKYDGLFWISYPKGTSKVKTDLNRDILWKDMEKLHLAGIFMVSIDNVWSAMRFRPAEKVGK